MKIIYADSVCVNVGFGGEIGGINPCLSSWKSAQADSVIQREALPCAEQAALAPRITSKRKRDCG